MPRAVHVLAFGIFAMVSSEFLVAGLMPQMAEGLDVSVSQIGYLITAFAVAMSVGGPVLSLALLRVPPRDALLGLFALFLVGNVLAATAVNYPVMLAARIVTGVAAQAFFGVALSLAATLTGPAERGRASARVMNGLMLGTLLGLPMATLIGERFGWRAAFWAISVLTLLAAAATLRGVPARAVTAERPDVRRELTVFRRPAVWWAFATSTLIIGATFAAFSYVNPVMTEITGFSSGTVPLLLVAYGAATVLGNLVVGRLADRYTVPVQVVGVLANAGFLAGLALLAHVPVPAVALLLGIGLVGVTMNPAMIVRAQRAGDAGLLLNTAHASFITLGVILGSLLGGLAIEAHGLRAPLWLGAGLAVLALGTLLVECTPAARARRAVAAAPSPASTQADAAPVDAAPVEAGAPGPESR
ncbi:MFS transporter [Streptomyces sp. DSM 44915]|uniref:MFS transporter n=1 Tax=Streptomyces chisholmiae TaxID=3075540 RepID=A0ABU2JSN9_9ACTN|nr:MFS transporter [Streptomyces sp. DSM 44915]MDT0268007.1 MFS transporter [Streptomyces sp. DSM 44915]